MNKSQLENLLQKTLSPKKASPIKKSSQQKKPYLKTKSPYESYCRCVLHVAARNPIEVNMSKSYGPGTGYANPYSICTKTTGRKGSFACGTEYDFDVIPLDELRAFAALRGMDPGKYKTRRDLVGALKHKQTSEK